MKARHELLLRTIGTIGVFDEETDAYQFATQFLWILPTIVICGGLFDVMIAVLYMRTLHPWKQILFGETESEPDVESRALLQDPDQGPTTPEQENISEQQAKAAHVRAETAEKEVRDMQKKMQQLER